ncbi:MAG: tetratricopeptide repeat protein, partial [Pseudomonadota bacterium]
QADGQADGQAAGQADGVAGPATPDQPIQDMRPALDLAADDAIISMAVRGIGEQTETVHWRGAEAEALTQICDDELAQRPDAPSGFDGALPSFSSVATPAISSVHASRGDDAAAPMQEIDRAWLEGRFSEIADRVEVSLAQLQSDDIVGAVENRVERLQEDISNALGALATRDDIKDMQPPEFASEELLSHLDRTDTKLDQLTSMDEKLAMVIAQLSDERFNALIAEVTPAIPTATAIDEEAFDRVADVAAKAVAGHFAEIKDAVTQATLAKEAPASDPSPAVDELREMLTRFIDDQRLDQKHNASALDTIQQAMLNILDRVEVIETGAIDAGHSGSPMGAQAATTPMAGDSHSVGDQGLGERGFGVPTGREDGSAMQDAPGAQAISQTEAAWSNASEPADTTPGYAPGRDLSGAEAPPVSTGIIAPDLPPMTTLESLRQDFIEDAKRAKANADVQRDQAMLADGGAGEAENGAKALIRGLRSGSARGDNAQAGDHQRHSADMDAVLSGTEIDEPAGEGRILGMRRNTLLIGAFVTLVAVTSALMLMGKDDRRSLPVAQPAAIERSHLTHDRGASIAAAQQSSLQNAGIETGSTVATPLAAQLQVVDGVDVQKADLPLNNYQLAKVEEKRRTALQSSRLGTQYANADPASLMNDFGVDTNALAQAAVSRAVPGSQLSLPPATVGPLSLRLAAAKGDPSAQFEVAVRLAEGKGTQQNFVEAINWYERSAKQGFAQSLYRLGTLYERGLGTQKDNAKAADYYRQAADRGNVKAMHNLAVLSASGSNASPDYTTAAQWFAKAADHGLNDSQFNLAVLFSNGLGVEKNLAEAYKFFALSARSGDAEAVKRRDELRGKLSDTEAAKADQLMAGWRPKRPAKIANDARAAGEEWKQRANGHFSS